jgi:hypothetical protein
MACWLSAPIMAKQGQTTLLRSEQEFIADAAVSPHSAPNIQSVLCVAYPAGPGYYGAAPAPAPVAYADGGYYAVAPAPVVVAPPVVIPFGGYYGGYRGGWGGHGGYWHR